VFSKKWNLLLTLVFFQLPVFAQPAKNYKEYDKNLIQQTNLTHEFAKTHFKDYAHRLALGSNHGIGSVYTFYIDKKYDFSLFEQQNFQELRAIERSNQSLRNSELKREEYLTQEEANSFLTKSSEVVKKVPRMVKLEKIGICFIHATHISSELFQQYPKLPVKKVWLSGPMFNEATNSRWMYHVAAAVPVKGSKGVEWKVLDPHLLKSGAVSTREWIEQTNAHHMFSAEVSLIFSGADRIISNFFGSLLKDARMNGLPLGAEKALFEADKLQEPE
jgi:hypothetical protein